MVIESEGFPWRLNIVIDHAGYLLEDDQLTKIASGPLKDLGRKLLEVLWSLENDKCGADSICLGR